MSLSFGVELGTNRYELRAKLSLRRWPEGLRGLRAARSFDVGEVGVTAAWKTPLIVGVHSFLPDGRARLDTCNAGAIRCVPHSSCRLSGRSPALFQVVNERRWFGGTKRRLFV